MEPDSAAQLAVFQKLTAALAGARTHQEIGEFIIDEVRPALHAEVGVVAVLSEGGHALRNVGFKGVTDETVDAWREYPLESPVPVAEAALRRTPVIVSTLEERNARYPVLAQVHGIEHGGAVAAFPLLARGELVGALGFCWSEDRVFGEGDTRFLQALADQCALAVERASWIERAQREIGARRSAEQRLEAVLESIDDHLVCYDREWRYIYVNDKAAQVLGKKKEALLGRSIWELFPDAVGNQYYQELHQAVAERRIIRSEHYYAPYDTWFENRIYPSADGVTVFSANVTWRRHAEEALREADRRKDEFLATLAHELRNPLAPLRTGVELIRRMAPERDPVRSVGEMMERQIAHLTHLVNDLLDVSRISEGKIELKREDMPLARALRSAVEACGPAIEEAGHTLTVKMPDEVLTVHGDSTRLAQVFGNLLSNAARYTPPGGRITVSAGREGAEAMVCVADDGIGLERAMLTRVFEMFTQAAPLPGASNTGLGIGLTIAKRMVELHGGTIAAESDGPGRGSRFIVKLPLVEAVAEAPVISIVPEKEHGSERPALRVLVADDNADAAEALASLLELTGKEVRIAADGLEAVRIAEEFAPHVVLLDIGMPRMDGIEAARMIRAQPHGTQPVLVALTGWGSQADLRRTRDAGFDHHLVKPVELEKLEGVLVGSARGASVAK